MIAVLLTIFERVMIGGAYVAIQSIVLYIQNMVTKLVRKVRNNDSNVEDITIHNVIFWQASDCVNTYLILFNLC